MDENTTENISLRMNDTTTRGKSQRTDDLSCLAAASALAGRQQVVRHRTMRQLHYDVHRRPVERDAVEVNNVRVAQLGENSALVAKFGRGIFVFGRHHQAHQLFDGHWLRTFQYKLFSQSVRIFQCKIDVSQ